MLRVLALADFGLAVLPPTESAASIVLSSAGDGALDGAALCVAPSRLLDRRTSRSGMRGDGPRGPIQTLGSAGRPARCRVSCDRWAPR
jgi:hypothetical protein